MREFKGPRYMQFGNKSIHRAQRGIFLGPKLEARGQGLLKHANIMSSLDPDLFKGKPRKNFWDFAVVVEQRKVSKFQLGSRVPTDITFNLHL